MPTISTTNVFEAVESATGASTHYSFAFNLGSYLENFLIAARMTGDGTATVGLEITNHYSPTADDWWPFPIPNDEELALSAAAPKNTFEIVDVNGVKARLVWHNLTGTNVPEAYVERKSKG